MKDIDENGVDRMERFRGYSQRFIQYSVADEVYRETLEYMQHLRQQRDEARRWYCRLIAYQRQDRGEDFDPEAVAVEYGWDCFAQQEGGGA